ncbi:MAG: phage holin family protein [Pseudomonadota bacterium]
MTKPITITENIRALVSDGILLVRQEIALAKSEASEKLDQMQVGIAAMAAGAIIALTSLIVLSQALVVALSNVMPASLAALAVGLGLAIIAFISIKTGQTKLKGENLAPRRTVRSVRETAEKVKEAV